MGIMTLPNGTGGFNYVVTPNSSNPTCPNCHKDEDIKEVCRHCGYGYPEPDDNKTSVAFKIFTSIIIVFVIGVSVFLIDYAFFNNKYYNKIFYGSDCNYEVPSGFKIVYNSTDKKYAVADLTFGDYYLYNGSYGITGMYSSISKPSVFDDSCEAKGYLKAYIKQTKSTMSNYK